jgi:hypothetical protein
MPLPDFRQALTRKNCLSWIRAAATVTPTPVRYRPEHLSPAGSDHLRHPQSLCGPVAFTPWSVLCQITPMAWRGIAVVLG